MADIINIASKQSGDTLTAGEVNAIVDGANAAIVALNTTASTVGDKVDKITGKGLSTEDYTTSEKSKLDGIAAGANNYTHPESHSLSMITETQGLKIMTADERVKLSGLTEHDKGFFANEAAIIVAYEVGQAGWFVRNGETDTVWVWDVEGEEWVDTGASGGGSATLYSELTYANAIIAMGAGTLVPGTTYKITDRGDRGLFFTAISTTQFAATGTRLMLCPATYTVGEDAFQNNWVGVWNSTKTVAIDDLTIWGGQVWKNLTADIGTATDDVTLDATNWVLIPKASFANHEYIEMVFGVMFDWANDWISKQFDEKGNLFGGSYGAYGGSLNEVDICDWGNANIYGNSVHSIFNIDENTIVESNNFSHKIFNCFGFEEIYDNSTRDNIHDCITNNNNSIYQNGPSVGSITGIWNTDVVEVVTNKTGSA